MTQIASDDLIKKAIAKVVAEVKDGNLFAPELPKWLEALPAGKYTVTELVSISGTGERNVQKVMKKFCPHVEYIESSAPHIKKCMYHWR